MPSQILHTLFGEDVIAALSKRLDAAGSGQDLICGHNREFSLGCQGPDIFYHNQRHKPVALEYGSLLHRRNFGIFAANLLEMALPSPPLAAYALGFATHAILDRHCHPYIIYKAGKNYHSFFERIIDVLMLKKLRLKETHSWDQEGLLSVICENPPSGLNELLVRAMAAAFPEKVQKDRSLAKRIDNAFVDSARFYRMSAPAKVAIAAATGQTPPANSQKRPALGMRALMYVFPENIPENIDFLNLQNKIWRYPYISPSLKETPKGASKDDFRSFLDIYAGALETAVNILTPCINEYFNSVRFPVTETANGIGNTSLSIQDENGKPCSANIHDPFPLEEVFRQQAVMLNIF